MSDEIPSYEPKDVPTYLTEEESRVLAMLAEKMICPECDAPLTIVLGKSLVTTGFDRPMDMVPLGPGSKSMIIKTIIPRSLTWDCTNSNCDQSK